MKGTQFMISPVRTRTGIAALAIACFTVSASAQWSNDPTSNLTLANRPGEQNQPKIAPTADGGCFISWFDNGSVNYKSDTLTWNGTAWTKQNVSGPSARVKH